MANFRNLLVVGDSQHTVAQLEATNLWQRLEAEAKSQGRCLRIFATRRPKLHQAAKFSLLFVPEQSEREAYTPKCV
jgi:hypothetical protein